MDKYEYNLKLDQMKSLSAEEHYAAAAEIADTINWNKIKNISAMVTAGEVYEKLQRYTESRDVLLLAYDRSPIGKNIIFRLAEVSIKMEDFDSAQEYYNEFVDIAPHDNLRYVLQYDMKKAQGAEYTELIPILEELKEVEYTEEWGYELAYLYHKAGMTEKCVDACDELILWFGDGPYVERALELKMIYQPLTKVQEDKYRRFRLEKQGITPISAEEMEKAGEYIHEPVEIPEVELDVSTKYNTVNLQKEIARGMQQIINATERSTVTDTIDNIKKIVGEIPYLTLPVEDDEEELDIKTDKEIDGSLKVNFQELLGEEDDGQMSLMTGEQGMVERQITGQMTIQEILDEWKKTQSAAKKALEKADQAKLESAKARALHEAEGIMERLTDAMPKLDAGMTPTELLREKYMEGVTPETIEAMRKEQEAKAAQAVKEAVDAVEEAGAVAEVVTVKKKDETFTDPSDIPAVELGKKESAARPGISIESVRDMGSTLPKEKAAEEDFQKQPIPADNVQEKTSEEKSIAEEMDKEGIGRTDAGEEPIPYLEKGSLANSVVAELEAELAAQDEERARESGTAAQTVEKEAEKDVLPKIAPIEPELPKITLPEGSLPQILEKERETGLEKRGAEPEETEAEPEVQQSGSEEEPQEKTGEETEPEKKEAEPKKITGPEKIAAAEDLISRMQGAARSRIPNASARNTAEQPTADARLSNDERMRAAHIGRGEKPQMPAAGKSRLADPEREQAAVGGAGQTPSGASGSTVIHHQERMRPTANGNKKVTRISIGPAAAKARLAAEAEAAKNRLAADAAAARASMQMIPMGTKAAVQATIAGEKAREEVADKKAAVRSQNDDLKAGVPGERTAKMAADKIAAEIKTMFRPDEDEEIPESGSEVVPDLSGEPKKDRQRTKPIPTTKELKQALRKRQKEDTLLETIVPKEMLDYYDDSVPKQKERHLTEEQKAVFSYFVPVAGMENQLAEALMTVGAHLKRKEAAFTGNLIIQGGQGCGKTVLATSMIRALQKETGFPNNKIGKIDAATLNKKDIQLLLKKVSGGCLIIEDAGGISRQAAVTLSLLMDQDNSGILVIMEDTSKGIKRALAQDEGFAKKFTQRISVPIFTNDDLVAFAKAYSEELGYRIDELAVLALYNRISNIQRLDQATTLTEVKEIVDEAIDREARGGIQKFFSILTAKRYDDDDKIILQEKDFE